MFLKMPILNKIQNVYRASRKLRPGMRIFERCKSSRLPPRFVNSRRGVTGGDILKDDYQKDLASNAKIHSKLRIEEPETGLVLDVNLKYSFRKIPEHLPTFDGDLEGDNKSKDVKNHPEQVWYDFIHEVDPDVLDLNRQFMLAERTKAPSVGSKSKVVTRKLSGSSLTSGKSHKHGKTSGRKSSMEQYKARVSGKIDITSPQFNPQQFSEALHGVVQTVMANSFHTLLQKVSEDQLQNRVHYAITRTLNPSKRRLSMKSSRSTTSHGSGVSRRKYGNSFIRSTESSKSMKGTWEKKNVTAKKSKEALKTVAISSTNITSSEKGGPLKSSVFKTEEYPIVIPNNNLSKETESIKTAASDTSMQDFKYSQNFANETFALASTHINPSIVCTNSKKTKIPADEIPPFYHIVPKLKEHEQSKSKSQGEKAKPGLDNKGSRIVSTIKTSAKDTKSNVNPIDGAHSKAPFLIGCHSNEPKTDKIVRETSDKSNTADPVKPSEPINKEVNPPCKQSTAPTTENLNQAVREFRTLYANFINSVKTGNNQKPDCSEGQCLKNLPKIKLDTKPHSSQGKQICGQVDEKMAQDITSTILKNLKDSMINEIKQQTSPEAAQKKAQKQHEDASILKATEKELQKAIHPDCGKLEVKTKESKGSHNKNSSSKDTTKLQNKDLLCEANKTPSGRATCQNGPSQTKGIVKDKQIQTKGPLTSKSNSVGKESIAGKTQDGKKLIECSKFKPVSDQTTKFPTTPNCPNQSTNPKSKMLKSAQSAETGCGSDSNKPIPQSSAKDCLQSSEKTAAFSTCAKQMPETKLTGNQTGLKNPTKNGMSFKMGEPIVEIRPVSHTFKKFEKASSLPLDCSKYKVLKVNRTDSPISSEKVDPGTGTIYSTRNSEKIVKLPSEPAVPPKQYDKETQAGSRGKTGQETSSTCVAGDKGKARSQPGRLVEPKQSSTQDDKKESSPVDCSQYDTNQVISKDKSRKAAGKDGQHLREKDTLLKHKQEICDTNKEKPVDKIKRGTSEVLSKDDQKSAIKSKAQSKDKLDGLQRSKSTESIQPEKLQTPKNGIPTKIPVEACSMSTSTSAKSMLNLSSNQSVQPAAIDCSKFKTSESFISKSLSDSGSKPKTESKPFDCSKYAASSKPLDKTYNQPKVEGAIDCSKYNVSDKKLDSSKQPDGKGFSKIDCSKYRTLDQSSKTDPVSKTACSGAGSVQNDSKVTLTYSEKAMKTEQKEVQPIDCSKYKSKALKQPEANPVKQSDCPERMKTTTVESKSPVETGKIDCSKYKTMDKATDKTDSSLCAGSGDCCKADRSCEKSSDCCKADGSCEKSSDSCQTSGDCGGTADCCKAGGSGGGSVDASVRTYGTQPKKQMVIDCDAWNRPGTCVNGEKKSKDSLKPNDSGRDDEKMCEILTDPPMSCDESPDAKKPISENQPSTRSKRLKDIDCNKYRDSFKSDSTVSCKYEITPTSAKFPIQTGSHTSQAEQVEVGKHKTPEKSKSSNTNQNERVETKKSVSETAVRTCSNTLNQAAISKRASTDPNNPTDVKTKESKIIHPVETKRSSSDVRPKPCSNTLKDTSAPSSQSPVETKESKITHPVETKRSSELPVKPCSNALNVAPILKKTSSECPQTPVEVKPKESNANQAVDTKKSTRGTRIQPCSNILNETSNNQSSISKPTSLENTCCRRNQSRVEIKPHAPYKPPKKPDDAQRSSAQDGKKQSKIPNFFRQSPKADKAKDAETMTGVGNKHNTRIPKSVGFQSVTSKPTTCQPVMCSKQKLERKSPCKTTEPVKADVAKRIQVQSSPSVFNCCLKVIGKKKVEIANCPMPTLCDDSVIIKMHSVGLCCSDVYMFENGIEKIETADISLGHEGAGEIFEVGSKVQSLKKGDRVCIEAGVPCARCKYCKEGRYNICPNMHFSGLLSTYCCHPASLCHKIPDSMSYEEAALVHPLSLGLQACHRGKVSIGSKVLILGACPLGLSVLMAARAMGADKIAIVDVLKKNLDVASELCADVSMVAAQSMTSKDLCKEILAKTKCRPNVIIDCCGCSKTVNMAVDLVEQGGSFVLAGCQAECVTLPTLTTLAKELCFHTSFRSSNMFPSAINLIKTGRACVTKMITHRTEFCSTQGGFDVALQDVENRAIKVMVNWPHENASKK